MRHHILMIAEIRQYLPLSVKEKLITASYNVTMIPANTAAIHDVREPISGILICADESVIGQHHSRSFINKQALTLLMERATMYNIPLFILGYPEELKVIKGIIPNYLISYEFSRPIEVNMTEVIDRFVKHQDVQTRKKILVVDDSGAMLRTVKAWLDDKYHVFPANSGVMAIKYLASNRPDLILLDYEMPICDGKQVLEMIRSEAEFADIPVIFLTNHGCAEKVQNVKHLKPKKYLLKSMAPFQIIKEIDSFFESIE